ncbi:MAG TPA: sugar phosphate isomerase/epimerase [Planctomycetota bacterium]|jgi:sugar phosphate isomerase/epimerase
MCQQSFSPRPVFSPRLPVSPSPCLLLLALAFTATLQAADAAKTLDNLFFPFCVTVPQEKLTELGYSNVTAIWPAINLDKDPPYGADVPDKIRKLKGAPNPVLWIIVQGKKTPDKDERAVKTLQDLAAIAEEAGVPLSIYPHTGDYVTTTRDALKLAKKVDRKNVGVTLNLCHELKNDQMNDLPAIVDEVLPLLQVVSICGADKKEKTDNFGWDKLIRPLGDGSYDVYAFLKKLKSVGFKGPIGIQCYGLAGCMGGKPGDPLPALQQSIKTWKEYVERMAKE